MIRLVGKSAGFPCDVHHRVQRIGDDDHHRIGRCSGDVLGDLLDDSGVDGDQIVPAHAGLSRQASRHDHHVAVTGRLVVAGPDDLRVKPLDRRRFAAGPALFRPGWCWAPSSGPILFGDGDFGDVEQDDVAQFLARRPVGRRRPDVSCPDDADLRTSHGSFPFLSTVSAAIIGKRCGGCNRGKVFTKYTNGTKRKACRNPPTKPDRKACTACRLRFRAGRAVRRRILSRNQKLPQNLRIRTAPLSSWNHVFYISASDRPHQWRVGQHNLPGNRQRWRLRAPLFDDVRLRPAASLRLEAAARVAAK